MTLKLWVENPLSDQIAARLNLEGRMLCVHDRNPCFLRCGVFRVEGTPKWSSIPKQERVEWMKDVERAVKGV